MFILISVLLIQVSTIYTTNNNNNNVFESKLVSHQPEHGHNSPFDEGQSSGSNQTPEQLLNEELAMLLDSSDSTEHELDPNDDDDDDDEWHSMEIWIEYSRVLYGPIDMDVDCGALLSKMQAIENESEFKSQVALAQNFENILAPELVDYLDRSRQFRLQRLTMTSLNDNLTTNLLQITRFNGCLEKDFHKLYSVELFFKNYPTLKRFVADNRKRMLVECIKLVSSQLEQTWTLFKPGLEYHLDCLLTSKLAVGLVLPKFKTMVFPIAVNEQRDELQSFKLARLIVAYLLKRYPIKDATQMNHNYKYLRKNLAFTYEHHFLGPCKSVLPFISQYVKLYAFFSASLISKDTNLVPNDSMAMRNFIRGRLCELLVKTEGLLPLIQQDYMSTVYKKLGSIWTKPSESHENPPTVEEKPPPNVKPIAPDNETNLKGKNIIKPPKIPRKRLNPETDKLVIGSAKKRSRLD